MSDGVGADRQRMVSIFNRKRGGGGGGGGGGGAGGGGGGGGGVATTLIQVSSETRDCQTPLSRFD